MRAAALQIADPDDITFDIAVFSPNPVDEFPHLDNNSGRVHTAPVKPSCGCFSRQWGATVLGGGMDYPFSFVSFVRLIRFVAQAEAATEPTWAGGRQIGKQIEKCAAIVECEYEQEKPVNLSWIWRR